MKFTKLTSRIQKEMLTVPHLWFAWHPVRINDTQIVWLEVVVRRGQPYWGRGGSGIIWKYMSKDDFKEQHDNT